MGRGVRLGSWEYAKIANQLDTITTQMLTYEMQIEKKPFGMVPITEKNINYLNFIDGVSQAVEKLREQIKFKNTIDVYR